MKGVRKVPSLGDSYVTMGAGARAVSRSVDEGQCLDAPEPIEEGSAGEALARRAGIPISSVPRASIVCLAQPAIVARNHRLLFDAEVGALADALDANGVQRAVIANADESEPPGVEGYQRTAGLSLADSHGVVPAGAVGPELITRDPSAPFGVRADERGYLSAFERVWRDRAVVLVEASDLARFEQYKPFVAADVRPALQMQLLQHFDTLVGKLLAQVDPAHSAVLLLGPSQTAGPRRLEVAALRAPGFEPGLLKTAWTRKSGFVAIVDVAPTILDQLGIARPAAMEGRPFEQGRQGGGDADARVDWLIDSNAASQFRDRMIPQVTLWFVDPPGRVDARGDRRVLVLRQAGADRGRAGGADAARLPSGDVPRRLVPVPHVARRCVLAVPVRRRRDHCDRGVAHDEPRRNHDADRGAERGGRADRHRRRHRSASPVQHDDGVFADGCGPLRRARESGVRTTHRAGCCCWRGWSPMPSAAGAARGSVSRLLVVAIVVDGAPMFGSDVGGVLSMPPAFAVTAVLLLGWRFRWRVVAWGALGTLVLLVVFTALDMTRPLSQRTHLGRLVENGEQSGFGAVWTVIHRKIDENTAVLFSSVWTIMLPLVLIALGYLIYRAPGRLRGIRERVPPLGAALAGVAIVAVLGFALNDSGIAIPGVMLGVLTPVLVVVTVRGERAVPVRQARRTELAA